MRIAAIIVAAGRGERAGGDSPKQVQLLAGKPVYQWSIDAFLAHDRVEQIILVVPAGEAEIYRSRVDDAIKVVPGGSTRTISVKAGLQASDLSAQDLVLIHDAARPGLNQDTISRLIDAMRTADAAAPALPVPDALKRKGPDSLTTVIREALFRVQTPQIFKHADICEALSQSDDLVDDLAAIEALNGNVTLVEGSELLAKITYPDDLKRLETLLMPATPAPRFGTGYDVHAFEPGSEVILCGVRIPHDQKLSGHSDADVAWHALTDAILGAAALGDIGDHFPPSDAKWKGVASEVFLKHAVEQAAAAGWTLSSCDLTVICEAPKVKPHRETMRAETARITGLPLDAISVKATTTEGLGFTGRREGIAAQASAVLSPSPNRK
ncbi:MAG: bifunctional 2-C-methyl-D-erythritol 4-phosphate cytidylyltransferase/2-C-methyl-D-erythritol 2,4-cyclodiphosphate synthase [Henriciella sp.]|jgi:2-C-methyl-D-erythritol 4-phosphate cytidylyltransferase / 2-C-methyl-D-erythritol 2,4-cyclodiphosphate synthase|nr:bifunctional 2-C-methyl-D-erythritol 4-phosphate cytidylyltransferase/2-C-methyl-D-erythritol 2,4-cyclodiphosphate synthase [Henriciella sp.]MBO6696341.1 bifunctional 2-C-methyl-D-erythritol 4-phosphate cytidylyltransferase/2-C-methyl-D-erythritol 2,4-cyclodiphosphate synthase [Henriciella sp.]